MFGFFSKSIVVYWNLINYYIVTLIVSMFYYLVILFQVVCSTINWILVNFPIFLLSTLYFYHPVLVVFCVNFAAMFIHEYLSCDLHCMCNVMCFIFFK